MPSAPLLILMLYTPLLLSLSAFVILFFVRAGGQGTKIKFQPFGQVVEFAVPISSVAATRGMLAALVPILLLPYLFYDYSGLFPQNLEMDVFFDEQGLQNSIRSTFTDNELLALHVRQDYRQYQSRYFEQIDREYKKLLGRVPFFGAVRGAVHSSGRTTFVVKKITGWQNYFIAESKGEITHILEQANAPPVELFTFFEKMPSRDDYVSPSLGAIFVRNSIVIRPRFKQILAGNKTSKGVVFSVVIVGVTKINLFPLPQFSNTIYCAEFGKEIGLVPLGYGIYR